MNDKVRALVNNVFIFHNDEPVITIWDKGNFVGAIMNNIEWEDGKLIGCGLVTIPQREKPLNVIFFRNMNYGVVVDEETYIKIRQKTEGGK